MSFKESLYHFAEGIYRSNRILYAAPTELRSCFQESEFRERLSKQDYATKAGYGFGAVPFVAQVAGYYILGPEFFVIPALTTAYSLGKESKYLHGIFDIMVGRNETGNLEEIA